MAGIGSVFTFCYPMLRGSCYLTSKIGDSDPSWYEQEHCRVNAIVPSVFKTAGYEDWKY